MKMVKDKQILVAADFGGFELKEAVLKHLKECGWTVTDVGMKAEGIRESRRYQRIGLRAGAMDGGRGIRTCPAVLAELDGDPYRGQQNAPHVCTARSWKPSLPPCGA